MALVGPFNRLPTQRVFQADVITPHGNGTRTHSGHVDVATVIEALLADQESTSMLLEALARAAARRLYA
jgi:hypothetical protein